MRAPGAHEILRPWRSHSRRRSAGRRRRRRRSLRCWRAPPPRRRQRRHRPFRTAARSAPGSRHTPAGRSGARMWTGNYVLFARRAGKTKLLPATPSRVTHDPGAGRGPDGRPAAAYQRCSRSALRDLARRPRDGTAASGPGSREDPPRERACHRRGLARRGDPPPHLGQPPGVQDGRLRQGSAAAARRAVRVRPRCRPDGRGQARRRWRRAQADRGRSEARRHVLGGRFLLRALRRPVHPRRGVRAPAAARRRRRQRRLRRRSSTRSASTGAPSAGRASSPRSSPGARAVLARSPTCATTRAPGRRTAS